MIVINSTSELEEKGTVGLVGYQCCILKKSIMLRKWTLTKTQ